MAGDFTVNGTVTYTIVLTNNGTGAQGDNAGNEFSDTLPATLALVSAGASSGTAVASLGTNTVTWNGAIPAGGSVTITITATILPAAAGVSVSNQGTIHYDGDGNGSNESSAVTDDPSSPGSAEPTTFDVARGAMPAIPTLSLFGLLVFSLSLLAFSALALRRRG